MNSHQPSKGVHIPLWMIMNREAYKFYKRKDVLKVDIYVLRDPSHDD
jgi:hypothetical protein